jgi:hypothetical protein
LNGDGTITLVDFNILKGNFGASGEIVPEPGTLALFWMGGIVAAGLGRRRLCLTRERRRG